MPITRFDTDKLPKPLDFLIPEYIPKGSITLCSGEPDVGKSRLLLQTAWALSLGESLWWEPVAPIKVLFASERDPSEVFSQMQALQLSNIGSNENFQLYTIGDQQKQEASAFIDDPLAYLTDIIDDTSPQLVILDTFTRFAIRRSSTPNLNDYGSMCLIMSAFKIWAKRRELGVLAVHHMRKQSDSDSARRTMDRSLGSQAMVGGASAIWMIEDPLNHKAGPDDWRYIALTCRCHSSYPPPPIYFKYAKDTPFLLMDESETVALGFSQSQARGSLQAALLQKVDKQPPKRELIKEVIEEENSDKGSVYRAYRALQSRHAIEEFADIAEETRVRHRKPH